MVRALRAGVEKGFEYFRLHALRVAEIQAFEFQYIHAQTLQ